MYDCRQMPSRVADVGRGAPVARRTAGAGARNADARLPPPPWSGVHLSVQKILKGNSNVDCSAGPSQAIAS